MTVASTATKTIVLGPGGGPFSYNFMIPTASDVEVIYTSTTGVETVLTTAQYAITGVGTGSGTVTLTGSPLIAGETLTILRNLATLQPTSLTNQGASYPTVVETALDRLTMIAQQDEEKISRVLTVAASDAAPGLLPTATARALKLLGFDANGNPAAMSSAPAGMISSAMAPICAAATLATAANALLAQQSYLPLGTGAASRTVTGKLQETVSLTDFSGVDVTGATDSAAGVQAAITFVAASGDAYELFVPEGVYRCDSKITIAGGIRIRGQGASPYYATIGSRGGGSWFYFNHTGIGFEIKGTASALLGDVSLANFGTYRNQPAPGVGWTPTANDYDIYIDNSDVLIDDLMLLNPTKGIYLTNGHYGRLEINRLRGQAFNNLIRINESYDVVKLNNVHQWPFWKDDSNVHAYTMSNLDTIYWERCDNPLVSNLFTIYGRSGMRFGQAAAGKVAKIHLVNADFDRGKYGVWVDSTVTTGVTGQLENVTYQGEIGMTGSVGILVEGDSSIIDFGSFAAAFPDTNGILVNGTGNIIYFAGQVAVDAYDYGATGAPAIEAGTGNSIRIQGLPRFSTSGASAKYGGAGKIYVDHWRTYAPTVASETGTITTLGAYNGYYKRHNNTITLFVEINITTNGTGATSVVCSLPETPIQDAILFGKETAVTGTALAANVDSGSGTIRIQTLSQTYPGGDGYRILINGVYAIQD